MLSRPSGSRRARKEIQGKEKERRDAEKEAKRAARKEAKRAAKKEAREAEKEWEKARMVNCWQMILIATCTVNPCLPFCFVSVMLLIFLVWCSERRCYPFHLAQENASKKKERRKVPKAESGLRVRRCRLYSRSSATSDLRNFENAS